MSSETRGEPVARPMNSGIRLSRAQAIGLAILVLVLLGVAMLFYEARLELKPGVALGGILTDAQSESIRVTLELIKLIMTWAIAVIGAAGFFLKLNIEGKSKLKQIDIVLTLVIIVAAVISLYFGHLALDQAAELLAVDQFPVGKAELRRLCQYQYLFFFAAVLLFGFHVFQFFWPVAAQTLSNQGSKQ